MERETIQYYYAGDMDLEHLSKIIQQGDCLYDLPYDKMRYFLDLLEKIYDKVDYLYGSHQFIIFGLHSYLEDKIIELEEENKTLHETINNLQFIINDYMS
jgi:hypothetical protein